MGKPAQPKLSKADQELIEAASDAIRKRYRFDWQEVGAALRLRSGKIFTGVSLDAYLGRMAVCAEAVALGQAMASGEKRIEAIVSIRHPRPREQHQDCKVVSPCGICREMLTDFAAGGVVILLNGDAHVRVPVEELLPAKYRRHP
jgi:cytidine deaminase